MLNELRGQGIAAGVYTQTTDVEGEINGLMTYDRRVIKVPAKELAELHKVLFVETPQNAAKAGQFKKEAFVEVPTDRRPDPVMDADTIRAETSDILNAASDLSKRTESQAQSLAEISSACPHFSQTKKASGTSLGPRSSAR